MKRVRKNAGNYLSKYMSKGGDAVDEYADRVGWGAVPRQWWNMSKSARDQVKRACVKDEGSMRLLECWVRSHFDGAVPGIFKFVRSIEVQATEFQSFVVGFWGRLTEGGLDELTNMKDGLKCV